MRCMCHTISSVCFRCPVTEPTERGPAPEIHASRDLQLTLGCTSRAVRVSTRARQAKCTRLRVHKSALFCVAVAVAPPTVTPSRSHEAVSHRLKSLLCFITYRRQRPRSTSPSPPTTTTTLLLRLRLLRRLARLDWERIPREAVSGGSFGKFGSVGAFRYI